MSVLTGIAKNGVIDLDGDVKSLKGTKVLVEIVEPTLTWRQEEEEFTVWEPACRGRTAGKPCSNNFRSTVKRTE